RNASVQGARVAVGANVGTAAVIEASKKATPAVVEAWLLERGQRFALDAKTLMQLADAGVPARVTDAMVAVSNPQQFAVAHEAPATQYNRPDDEVTGRRIPVFLAPPPYDPFSWGYSPYGYGYGYPYGYGYNGYGYGGYGYGGYYGYPYYGRVIVVPVGNVPSGGRMVRGQGYQPGVGASSTGRTAKPRNQPSPTDSRAWGSSNSSGSSSAGSSSSGSSQPATPTRTAKPRP
ncbi:MAG TPA: hypothetical protein VF034_12265, partial [Gemmatimonadaceae bacterium]